MSSPIRILHIVTHMERGGLETMIMNYYRAIDRQHIQFDFLVHRSTEAAYDHEILSLGGTIYHLPPLNPFNPSYLHALDNFFAKHPQYRLVHCHLDCMSAIPLKYAKKHGIPVRIAHAHSSSQDRDWKYLLKSYYKTRIGKYATDLFACSLAAGKWTFGKDNFKVLPNAIDAKAYAFDLQKRTQLRLQLGLQDRFVIGHVGRFCPVKNHQFLLKVFAEIAKSDTESILLLVGDGSLRPAIEKHAKDLALQERVRFLGIRPDVSDLLQVMDVFLFPSLFEGLPVSLIEAQAAGLPCLISDRVPIESKKTDGVCQLSLDTDITEWANTLLNIARIPRKNTLEQIQLSGFDIKQNAGWLANYYKKKYDESPPKED